jgi:hydrogenase small subunit
LFPVLWIEGASCTGCTESFAQIETPDVGKVVLELISLNYSDVLSAGAGYSVELAKKQTIESGSPYIVVYEGGITQGFGSNTLRVAMETGEEILCHAASKAAAVVALGSCAVNGGWMAAYPNPAQATGVSAILKKLPGNPCGAASPMSPAWST